ncbi:MAG: hypothetical protein WCU88_01790 [Elusimicrobiota bacterium]|jgi:hypothetical protein
MRYWLYHDTRILGPFSREDLASQSSLGPESLVCEEGAGGACEKDWRTLGSLTGSSPSAGVALADPPAGFDAFREFKHEAGSALQALGISTDLGAAVFADPSMADLWPSVLQGSMVEGLPAGQDQYTAQLEDRLVRLKEEFVGMQERQREVSEEIERKDRLIAEKERSLAELRGILERRRVLASEAESVAASFGADPAGPAIQRGVSTPESVRADPAVLPMMPTILSPAPSPQAPKPVPAPIVPSPMPEIPVLPAARQEDDKPSIVEIDLQEIPAEEPAVPASEVLEIPSGSAIPEIPAVVEIPSASQPPAVVEVPSAPETLPVVEVSSQAGESPKPSAAAVPAQPPQMFEIESLAGGAQIQAAPLAVQEPQAFEVTALGGSAALESAAVPLPETGMLSMPAPSPVGALSDLPPPLELGEAPVMAPPPPFVGEAVPPKTVIFSMQPQGGEVHGVSAMQPPPFEPAYPFMPKSATQTDPMGRSATPAGQPKTILFGAPLVPSPGAAGAMGTGTSAAPSSWGAGSPAVQTESPFRQPVTPTGKLSGSSMDMLDMSPTDPGRRPTLQKTPSTDSPSTFQKRRSGNKGFLVVLGSGIVILILLAAFFLHNPKEMRVLVDMGPQKKAQQETELQPMDGLPPAQPSPAAPVAGQAASVDASLQTGAPAASGNEVPVQAAPAVGSDFIQDESIQALEIAKNHVLDKARGNISQWLQYSFLSPGNEEEWSSAAVQKDIYLVTYRVFKGGRRNDAQPITYLFEVDLPGAKVLGKNPSARSLLGGPDEGAEAGLAGAQDRGGAASRPKTKAARKARAAAKPASHDPPPLPDDEELDRIRSPRRAKGFNNPGPDGE